LRETWKRAAGARMGIAAAAAETGPLPLSVSTVRPRWQQCCISVLACAMLVTQKAAVSMVPGYACLDVLASGLHTLLICVDHHSDVSIGETEVLGEHGLQCEQQ
jgi:hypothetical protein